jgi:pSer/pThr/pTyr-binding forkhead associated (FHA) protein
VGPRTGAPSARRARPAPGSKNGTFLREERISGPVPLADGDYFRLGRRLLVFHSPREAVPTRTEVEG